MTDIFTGAIIETNQGRVLRFKVVLVIQDCTCPDPQDWFKGVEDKATKPHYHLELEQLFPIENGMNTLAYKNHIEIRSGVGYSIFKRYECKEEFRIIHQPDQVQLLLF